MVRIRLAVGEKVPLPWRWEQAVVLVTSVVVATLSLTCWADEISEPDPARQTTAEKSVHERIAQFELQFHTRSEAERSYWTLAERMERHHVPGLSVAVVRDGQLAWARGFGHKQAGTIDPVDSETVFSVGSLSKVATAAATLRLVDQGTLDLDVDVNNYMTQWKIPDSELTVDHPITLRRIMSHTAGLTVHGFKDFQPDEALPTTLDILNGAGPAKNQPVRVAFAPGTRFKYSGGGVTIEQQIIEETLSSDFATATNQLVFVPLQMTRSTFKKPATSGTWEHRQSAQLAWQTPSPAAGLGIDAGKRGFGIVDHTIGLRAAGDCAAECFSWRCPATFPLNSCSQRDDDTRRPRGLRAWSSDTRQRSHAYVCARRLQRLVQSIL